MDDKTEELGLHLLNTMKTNQEHLFQKTLKEKQLTKSISVVKKRITIVYGLWKNE